MGTIAKEYWPELIAGSIMMFLAMLCVFVSVFVVHEFGHYLVARRFGVRVKEFSVGYGKTLWQKTDKNKTHWSIHLFPVGGHVRLYGSTSPEITDSAEEAFCHKPLWQRMLIIAAGPGSNILFSGVLMCVACLTFGIPALPPYIVGVETGKPAALAGIEPGDRVLEFDGKPILRYETVSDITKEYPGVPYHFKMQHRDGRVFEADITPERHLFKNVEGFDRDLGKIGVFINHNAVALELIASVDGIDTEDDIDNARSLLLERMGRDVLVGIDSDDTKIHIYKVRPDLVLNGHLKEPGHPVYDKVYLGVRQGNFYVRDHVLIDTAKAIGETGRLISGFGEVLGQIATGHGYQVDLDLVTPTIRVEKWSKPFYFDPFPVFYFAAYLSIVIALVNLIPFPGFDGSALLLLAMEGVMGPALTDNRRRYVLRVCMILIVGIVMFSNINGMINFLAAGEL